MSIYTPSVLQVPNGLDELGLKYSLQRLPEESLSDYRQRLLLEARSPSGSSQREFIQSVSRKVGLFDLPIFSIDLILDGDDEPLAADPFIEVTSTYLRVYEDFDNETLDFEVSLVSRSSAYFLEDVQAEFEASTFFSLEVMGEDYLKLRSSNLRYDNTARIRQIGLVERSFSNDLGTKYVKTFHPQIAGIFMTEQASVDDLAVDGDFYIDYTNGVVFTHTLMEGFASYTYRQFPYILYWQPVRSFPFNDSDIKYLIKATQIQSDGTTDYTLLNSTGAQMVNEVLEAHPMGWGE